MANRFRRLIEAIVFAGMKSGKPRSASDRTAQPVPLLQLFESLLSGRKNADPLYLSNRTWKGQVWLGLKIALPLAAVGGGVTWYLLARVSRPPPPKYDLTPAEVAAKLRLPDLGNVKSQTNRDLEVVEVGVDRSGPVALAGVVRNTTAHTIASAEVDFDVADTNGSRVGKETARFHDLAPEGEARFRIPIAYENATLATVRGIRTK